MIIVIMIVIMIIIIVILIITIIPKVSCRFDITSKGIMSFTNSTKEALNNNDNQIKT